MFDEHDCFSVTELVTLEDLGISQEGKAIGDVLDGFYDASGKIPCQIDGGLKCFGHPIGASGLRMIYEMYLQLSGRAGERQRPDPVLGMTHNLGGFPSQNMSAITIPERAIGQHPARCERCGRGRSGASMTKIKPGARPWRRIRAPRSCG